MDGWQLISEFARADGVTDFALAKWKQRGVPHKLRLPYTIKAAERGATLRPEDFEPAAAERQPQQPDQRHPHEAA